MTHAPCCRKLSDVDWKDKCAHGIAREAVLVTRWDAATLRDVVRWAPRAVPRRVSWFQQALIPSGGSDCRESMRLHAPLIFKLRSV